MSPIFPGTYSTLSPVSLGLLIAEKYDWSKVQCQFLLRGVSDTYIITTSSGRYILRVYRSSHRDLSQITAEVELLNILRDSGVSVAYPVPDVAGSFVLTVEALEGTRHAVVFSYAQGEVYSALSENKLRLLGREMAKFHNVSTVIQLSGKRWSFDFSSMFTGPLSSIRKYFDIYPDGYAWLQEASAHVQNKLSRLNTSGFSSGYCHFDFLPKNFHFDGDQTITFFDFDFFGYGWLINDIMTFHQHLCLDVQAGRMSERASKESFQIFLRAYREVRAVSDEELSAIPFLSLGFWLFYFGFYTTHDQFLPLLYDPHLKARVNLIRQIHERYERISLDGS